MAKGDRYAEQVRVIDVPSYVSSGTVQPRTVRFRYFHYSGAAGGLRANGLENGFPADRLLLIETERGRFDPGNTVATRCMGIASAWNF